MSQPIPDARAVEKAHRNSDLDSRSRAQHHTLGSEPNQASPGRHKHDGTDSVYLLEGITLTGSRNGNVALLSVIQALTALGATDSTTP